MITGEDINQAVLNLKNKESHFSTNMSREEIIEKVKRFYTENKIKKEPTVPQEQVMARLVLYTEWLQNQNETNDTSSDGDNTETWQDIFDAQPD